MNVSVWMYAHISIKFIKNTLFIIILNSKIKYSPAIQKYEDDV